MSLTGLEGATTSTHVCVGVNDKIMRRFCKAFFKRMCQPS